MASFRRFEDITSWQKARRLTHRIYAVSQSGSLGRDFSLRDQMRRASVSIMSNIAEGFERDGNREFLQFLSNAKGSAGEVRSQLYVALDAGHLSQEEFDRLKDQIEETSKLLAGLMRHPKNSSYKGRTYR